MPDLTPSETYTQAPPDSQKIDKGHCLCEAVSFTLIGEPLYNVVCHCENCRRQGGSILHCASIFLRSQFELNGGEDKVTTYKDSKVLSGKELHRNFCSICGGNVFAKTPLNKDIISIPAGMLDSANQTASATTLHPATAPWRPHKEQFCNYRAGWVPEFGDLIAQKFETTPGEKAVGELTK